ncbi:MAG: hypothetical protein OHK93_004352 [Ramalina farinacea]|uniref:polynucleotide adenylyltransferase n=1 Tax=Ramalina farinacea TaxID=258253 RepID=A0AA43QJQ2_9LECA|nr:hypothetical protein [Ramalina farinacea]
MDPNLHSDNQQPSSDLSYDGTANQHSPQRGPPPSVRIPSEVKNTQRSYAGRPPQHAGQKSLPDAQMSRHMQPSMVSTQTVLSPTSPKLHSDGFPQIRKPNPDIRLPSALPQPSQENTAMSAVEQVPASLEDRMRGMILQNDPAVSVDTTVKPGSKSNQRPPREDRPPHSRNARGNQAERKRRAVEDRSLLTHAHQQVPGDQLPNTQPKANQPPHPRRSRNHLPSDDPSRHVESNSREARQSWRGGMNVQSRPNGSNHQTQSQYRPPPRHHQLFNPNDSSMHTGGLLHRPFAGHGYGSELASNHDQLVYIQQFAASEIANAEITPEELEAKQQLGQVLAHICRDTVARFEVQENPDFSAESVDLKPFGSLATTFATKCSDMDLVLVSPQSKTDASSIESPLPRLVEKALLDAGYGVRLLTRTRVPIIKFCSEPTVDLAARLKEARMKWEKEQEVPEAGAEAKAKDSQMSISFPQVTAVSADSVTLVATILSPRPTTDEDSEISETTAKSNDPPAKPTGETSAAIDDPGTQLFECDKLSSDQSMEPTASQGNETGHKATSSDICQEQEQSDRGILGSAQAAQALHQAEHGLNEGHEELHGKEEHATAEAHRPADDGPTSNLEQDDPSLSQKPDEERIRLYRLAMREEWYEASERIVIYAFIQAVERKADVAVVDETRNKLKMLPNVLRRYKEPREKMLDFPKDGVGIQCDINFSNLLAIHNSTLLRCYSLCDKRVRPMVLFVKIWAKKRKINSAYESTLSSYGYVLMVLHYLMNVASPPIIPNLQHFSLPSPDPGSTQPTELGGYNIRFYRNEDELSRLAWFGHLPGSQNPASLETLIRGFFHYFGSNDNFHNFHWMRDCLSLRTIGGIVPKESKGWTAAKTEIVNAAGGPKETKDIRQRYLIAIEDPFETHHNVGRTVSHEGIVAIRDESRRANYLITHAGRTGPNGKREDLMGEHAGRPNLHYRYFGPRPRKKTEQQQRQDTGKARSDNGASKVREDISRENAKSKHISGKERQGVKETEAEKV